MPTAPTPDPLLNITEAALYLHMSPLTLRNWVRDREIEYIKVGKNVRFRKSTLDALLVDGTVPKGGNRAT